VTFDYSSSTISADASSFTFGVSAYDSGLNVITSSSTANILKSKIAI